MTFEEPLKKNPLRWLHKKHESTHALAKEAMVYTSMVAFILHYWPYVPSISVYKQSNNSENPSSDCPRQCP